MDCVMQRSHNTDSLASIETGTTRETPFNYPFRFTGIFPIQWMVLQPTGAAATSWSMAVHRWVWMAYTYSLYNRPTTTTSTASPQSIKSQVYIISYNVHMEKIPFQALTTPSSSIIWFNNTFYTFQSCAGGEYLRCCCSVTFPTVLSPTA